MFVSGNNAHKSFAESFKTSAQPTLKNDSIVGLNVNYVKQGISFRKCFITELKLLFKEGLF